MGWTHPTFVAVVLSQTSPALRPNKVGTKRNRVVRVRDLEIPKDIQVMQVARQMVQRTDRGRRSGRFLGYNVANLKAYSSSRGGSLKNGTR